MPEELINELLENPEAAVVMGYTGLMALGASSFMYKSNFGAKGMTNKDLSEKIEEAQESLVPGPLEYVKARKYREELSSRVESVDLGKYEDVLEEPILYKHNR